MLSVYCYNEQFIREIPEKVDKDKTWQWLSKSDLKIGKAALLWATQEQVIRTNYQKHYIDDSSESPLRRLSEKKGKIVQYLVRNWLIKNILHDTTI